jgi:hypothetical protein
VIIAARTNLYINEPARLGAIGATGWTRDPVEKERLFAAGLAGELRALTRQRIPVILVHVIPELSANPRNCAVLTIMLGDCSATTPRTAAVARVRLAWAAEDAAVRGLPVTTLNLEDRLCSATVCAMRPQPDDPLMYWDEQHLSVAGAETFTGAFYRAITAHARPRTRG